MFQTYEARLVEYARKGSGAILPLFSDTLIINAATAALVYAADFILKPLDSPAIDRAIGIPGLQGNSLDFYVSVVLNGCLLYPIIEETVCRLPIGMKGGYLQKFLHFLASCVFTFIFLATDKVLFWMVPLLAIYCLVLLKRTSRLEKETSVRPTGWLLGYSALFAVGHAGWNPGLGVSLRGIIAFIPYFVMGLQFGFIRIRVGFLHAVVQHILTNSLIILPAVAAQIYLPLWNLNVWWKLLGCLGASVSFFFIWRLIYKSIRAIQQDRKG